MNATDLSALEHVIDAAFDNRDTVTTATRGEIRDAIETALNLLDSGKARVATRGEDGNWTVHQWLKKAVLLSFRLNGMEVVSGGPGGSTWWDKVPSKFEGWSTNEFERAGFRAVPNAVVRRSAYIAPNAILMPSFVNLGAYVGEGTMVDTWATVGSCAQIGAHVHLSGGVGIGGVLEPMQAGPTIIEDNCFSPAFGLPPSRPMRNIFIESLMPTVSACMLSRVEAEPVWVSPVPVRNMWAASG